MRRGRRRSYAAAGLALMLLVQGCLSGGVPVHALDRGEENRGERAEDDLCRTETGTEHPAEETDRTDGDSRKPEGETGGEEEKTDLRKPEGETGGEEEKTDPRRPEGETGGETEKDPEEPEEDPEPEPEEPVFPEWTLVSAVNDAGTSVISEDGVYYFRGCLTVLLQVDQGPAEGDRTDSVIIRRNGIELTPDDGAVTDTLYDSGKYVYAMETEDGSQAPGTVIITAEKVTEAPALKLRYTPEPVEVQGRFCVQNVPDILLCAGAPAGISRIEYDAEEDSEKLLKEFPREEVSLYGEHTDCEILLNEAEGFQEMTADLEDGRYCWKFRVTDVLGGTAEAEAAFIVDRTAPDRDVFVSYDPDGTGTEGVRDTGIMEFVYALRDRLFGKSRIRFDLYVRDGILPGREDASSGLDVEDLMEQITAADGRAEVRELQRAEEGLVSFICNGVRREGYVHIKGMLVLPAGGHPDGKERLCIGRLKDRVGNLADGAEAEPVIGSTVLYFDRTPPVLSADWGAGVVDENCRKIFYREEALIRLNLAENNYRDFIQEDKEPVTPRIREKGSAGLNNAGWAADDRGAHTELCFPAPAGEEEAEYEFTVEYQDGSGNLLETDHTCAGRTEQGVYTGYPVVVDLKAPLLTDFSISGVSGGLVGDTELYQNVEGNDTVISFTINDHPDYWDPDRVLFCITDRDTGEKIVNVKGGALHWERDGRDHRGVYGFDGGNAKRTACYEVQVSCEDRAGNPLEGGGEWTEHVADGVFVSRPFLLDHEAPVFGISFGGADRLVLDADPDPSGDLMECMPKTGYTAYYREAVSVFVSVRERCMKPVYEGRELTGVQDLCVTVTGEDGSEQKANVNWKKQGDVCEGSFVLAEEGRYRISVSYRDPAGNAMISGRADGSRQEVPVSEDGIYESILLVVDRTAPALRLSCVDRSGKERQADRIREEDQCAYFSEPVYLKLEAEDQGLRMHELLRMLEGIRITDGTGTLVTDSSVAQFLEDLDPAKLIRGSFVFYIPLWTEAVYELPVGCEDLAGNRVSDGKRKICVDRTGPELLLSCSVEKSGFMDALRWRDMKYLFADSQVKVRVQAEDRVSGIRRICCTFQENGTTEKKEMLYEPAGSISREFNVPVQASDYKGTVAVEVWDWSGNHTVREWGQIVESSKKHRDTGRILIRTDTAPGRTIGGVDYYNTDIRFRLSAEDRWSGLRNLTCTGGRTIEYQKNFTEGDALRENGILYAYSEEMLLEAVKNNENGVTVRAEYQDLAGHTEAAEQLYHIDMTPPVLKVAYDNNDPSEGGLYDRSRTAVVTIQERNFDPSDVEFLITSAEGNMPQMGEWEHTGEGDDSLHVCRVLFVEDGDYTFSVNFTDLAGNRAEYGKTDAFIIDQTPPVLSVSYEDGADSGRLYFDRSRTAVIDLKERYFDPSRIQVSVEAPEGVPMPSVSGWSRDGDHHRASVIFASDGEYTMGITGADLAGNEMEPYGPDHFIIDQTPPELVILGVENHSANNKEIRPRIICSDANYSEERMEIRLEGALKGVLEPEGSRIRNEKGELFQMEDFAYEPEADDLYRLTAEARDLAGNKSLAEVLFSVNRFGSVYTLEEKTELLAGSRGMYYTRQEQDIIVTETNVDSLEFQEITLSLNGKLSVLKEGTDYSVQSSGNRESWKQYVYRIPARNFEQEGTYILTICSEDQAANSSDNHTKGKKIEFAVDKTGPSILLSGVEDGGRYRERSREVTLDIQDNIKIGRVKVEINGIPSTWYASEVERQDGRLRLMVGNDRRWQSIRVTAYDAAGNRGELETGRFLVTPDLLVQFFMDKRLFYGSMGGMAAVWAGAWHMMFRRRRPGK